MIPFFRWTVIPLGPISLQVWGLFAALGVVLGAWYAGRVARRSGLDGERFDRVAFWVILGAFVGARLLMIAYEPGAYLADPLELLRLWHGGFSSFGGFLGATATFLWLVRRQRLAAWPTADALVRALPLGLGCGRIGCFLIHDHPGTLAYGAGQWFAVNYPGGGRYDLGLLLGVFDFLVFGALVLLARRPRAHGFFIAVFALAYAPVRFLLDFLRVADARYFGLTPAQYGCLLLLAVGGLLAGRFFRPAGENGRM